MELAELVRLQGGVISLAQARACGLCERTVQRRVAAKDWVRLHPGVYLDTSRTLDGRGRIRAAALWLGEHATVSGLAAAFWHGLVDRPPACVEITLPERLHRAPRPGVVIRRRDLAPADRVHRDGLIVTGRPLTVLEVAARDGAALLDRALQQRQVTYPQLQTAFARMKGGRGATRASALLRAAAIGADSTAERLLLRILRGAGITGWVLGHRVGRWKLDVAFPERKVAIEFDSWAWHTEHDRFVDDRRKTNDLLAAGWTPLRFTWRDLTETPEQVLAHVRRALEN
jgi:very-short-patch-repair endonuclease